MDLRHIVVGGVAVAIGWTLLGCSESDLGSQIAGSDNPGMAVEPDYDAWEPTTQVVAPTFTAEEEQELLERYIRDQKSRLPEGVVPPAVEVVRRVAPDDEMTAIYECLLDAGYNVTMPDQYSISYSNPDPNADDVEPGYVLADYVCSVQYPPESKVLAGKTEESLAVEYEYQAEFYLPCLDFYGIKSTGPVPSKESFISDVLSGNPTNPWRPQWGADWLIDTDGRYITEQMTREELDLRCPQGPKPSDLLG